MRAGETRPSRPPLCGGIARSRGYLARKGKRRDRAPCPMGGRFPGPVKWHIFCRRLSVLVSTLLTECQFLPSPTGRRPQSAAYKPKLSLLSCVVVVSNDKCSNTSRLTRVSDTIPSCSSTSQHSSREPILRRQRPCRVSPDYPFQTFIKVSNDIFNQ